jgi:predicted 2-oxoglutarate/Fe(II)-dependent dioxygenase YbiX
MKEVLIIRNYLTNQQCDELLDIIHGDTVPFHKPHDPRDTHWHNRVKYPKYSGHLMYDLSTRRIETATEYFQLKFAPVVQSLCLNVWREGMSMGVHSDETGGRYPTRNYASMIYLNDDYEGGELYIPELNFSQKPEKGMLMTFAGGRYGHGITEIKNGTRYTNSCWIEELK